MLLGHGTQGKQSLVDTRPFNNALPDLTLVFGGASSGKSRFAEDLACSGGTSRLYIATARAWDDEMRAKIECHRAGRGPGWRTVEEPVEVARVLTDRPRDHVALLDCATLWLSNILASGEDLPSRRDELLAALASEGGPVIVVSNEVGMGIVPDNRQSREFRDAQGQLNRRIAELADLVVFVAAGLPLPMKGSLP